MQARSLSDALFTATQQKVPGLLYGKPDQSFYANEIARWAQVGKGSLMRESDRLHRAGVLTLNRQGNQTHYQANPECLIYGELLGLSINPTIYTPADWLAKRAAGNCGYQNRTRST